MSNDSELYRHQCEVRYLIKTRLAKGKYWLREFLSSPKVKARRESLERDIREQWRLGNVGEHGTWLEGD